MFHLEHSHCTYRRSLARETKYGSKQAPIGDDNYLHLAGAAGTVDSGQFIWRPWRHDTSPTVDLDGTTLPLQSSLDIGSSTESLKLARHGDERSSGKSTKSTGSGYLTMSCLKHEPSEDSDGSAEKPARPPKPARLSPARTTTLCEYVEVEPRPPERRPKPDIVPPRRIDNDDSYRCKEYELMTNFMSHSRPADDDAPPAVPPRGQTASRARLHPKPELDVAKTPDGRSSPLYGTLCVSTGSLLSDGMPDEETECLLDKREGRPMSKIDTVSNDDSLLDELQRDAYCVLKVCEDDPPEEESKPQKVNVESTEKKEKEDYGMFSRISIQRKSNPIKTQPTSVKSLKTSNSTSNVHDAGATTSRPLTERLTPFFLKKKPKPPEEATAKNARKEDNLIGLTPRFGQSRLYGRGQSLELAPPESRTKRIERSATTVNIPREPRQMNSSIVANLKFLSLHRYGAQEDVQCRGFVRTDAEGSAAEAGAGAAAGAGARAAGGAEAGDALDAAAWRRSHAPSLLAAATSDIRL